MHVFDKAGLGVAPFRYIGVESKVGPIQLNDGTTIGAPGQPMGCCDYCGTGIKDCYKVQSADGKTFVVGCDCVTKLAKADNVKYDATLYAIKQDAKKLATAKRHAREDAKLAKLEKEFSKFEGKAASLPHPVEYRAAKGESLAAYVAWFKKNAGKTGYTKALQVAVKLCS